APPTGLSPGRRRALPPGPLARHSSQDVGRKQRAGTRQVPHGSGPDTHGGVMDRPVSSLPERQNLPALLRLLRASAVSNARSRRLDGFTFGVSLAVAALGPVSGFTAVASEGVALLGAIWAGVSATGLAAWGRRERRRAALAQEMFDVDL